MDTIATVLLTLEPQASLPVLPPPQSKEISYASGDLNHLHSKGFA